MKIQLRPGIGLDDLLAMPWDDPMSSWDDGTWATGVAAPPEDHAARHDDPTRFVELEGTVIAMREGDVEDVERQARVLRALVAEGVSAREVIGVVTARGVDGTLPAVLLTAVGPEELTHVDVLAEGTDPSAVLDAAVGLLVQLHLAGVVWSAPSLSRVRFRRDAGAPSAILVELGPGDRVDDLTTRQRLVDLEAAAASFAAGLVAAGADEDVVGGLHSLRHEVRHRYLSLWDDLTRQEAIAGAGDDHGSDRLRRVNELGFDVSEIEVTDDGSGLRLGAAVIEPGHHRRRLQRLTRLVVQENQARRLLADIESFGRSIGVGADDEGEAVAAARWYAEVFAPTVEAVPSAVRRPGQDDAEVFHEVLEHRYYLSERAGHDVGTAAAVDAYVTDVLAPSAPSFAPSGGAAPQLR